MSQNSNAFQNLRAGGLYRYIGKRRNIYSLDDRFGFLLQDIVGELTYRCLAVIAGTYAMSNVPFLSSDEPIEAWMKVLTKNGSCGWCLFHHEEWRQV